MLNAHVYVATPCVWIDRSISLSSNIWLRHSLGTSIFCMFVNHGPSQQSCKKDTSHGNEVLPRDTMHLIQRPCYNKEVCVKIQQAFGPHKDLLAIVKRCKMKWYGHVSRSRSLANLSCKAYWKEEEDKADRKRGWKIATENGQAWSSQSLRGQWKTEKNGGNWMWSHLWCPQRSNPAVKG